MGHDHKRKWYVFDGETDPFQHQRELHDFAWGVYDGIEFRHWWNDRDAFVKWLADQDAVFYAHNGGRFDVYFLLAAGFRHVHGNVVLINGRIVSLHFGRAEIRDSWTLCPIPLGAYAKDEIDYRKFEADVREQHKAEILEYLYGDCRYLHELLSAFFAENAGLPLTLPGAAMRQLCKVLDVSAPRAPERYDDAFRGYYYGGRCQAFRKGAFPAVDLEILDINSAYPFAMTSDHWWGRGYVVSRELPPDPRTSLVSLVAVSRGALPYREERASLHFPDDGEPRTYHVTGHEIVAGLETGTLDIREILEVRTPEETLSMGDYVSHYWHAKEAAERDGDTARRHIAKIMLNGAYGKFAQDPRGFMDYHFTEEGEDYYETMHEYYEVAGRVIVGMPSKNRRFYNVCTAASITGAVRATLWKAICASEDVYYCDTDSLICRKGNVRIGDRLGEWKREARVSALAIGGKKLYAADLVPNSGPAAKKMIHSALHGVTTPCKIASKGAKLSREDVWTVARGGIVEWHSPAPTFSPRVGGSFYVSRQIRMT